MATHELLMCVSRECELFHAYTYRHTCTREYIFHKKHWFFRIALDQRHMCVMLLYNECWTASDHELACVHLVRWRDVANEKHKWKSYFMYYTVSFYDKQHKKETNKNVIVNAFKSCTRVSVMLSHTLFFGRMDNWTFSNLIYSIKLTITFGCKIY